MSANLLRSVLGDSYGGPSISFQEYQFCLYRWGDAPPGTEILVQAASWKEFIKKLEKYHLTGEKQL